MKAFVSAIAIGVASVMPEQQQSQGDTPGMTHFPELKKRLTVSVSCFIPSPRVAARKLLEIKNI